jgi:TonB family protein
VSPPARAVPQSEPAKPQEEGYVAPVLIAQEGVQTPRELLPILTRPVAVSVRVDVNEAGRVTRAEAIAEKGIHALLLNAATDAARRCRFQPARRGQTPVSSNVTIVFHINPEKQ